MKLKGMTKKFIANTKKSLEEKKKKTYLTSLNGDSG